MISGCGNLENWLLRRIFHVWDDFKYGDPNTDECDPVEHTIETADICRVAAECMGAIFVNVGNYPVAHGCIANLESTTRVWFNENTNGVPVAHRRPVCRQNLQPTMNPTNLPTQKPTMSPSSNTNCQKLCFGKRNIRTHSFWLSFLYVKISSLALQLIAHQVPFPGNLQKIFKKNFVIFNLIWGIFAMWVYESPQKNFVFIWDMPSKAPSLKPTSIPTHEPSQQPTNQPTQCPTACPSKFPSLLPTKTPSSKIQDVDFFKQL